jgi:transcriptional regulator with XRE-family HTH domain
MLRDEELLQEFGRRVKVFREERGYSQDELAERSGITGKHVGDLERGAKEPGLLALLGLAGALDVDLVTLVPFRAGADPFAPRPTYKEWEATLHAAQHLVALAARMSQTADHFRAARLPKPSASRAAASRRPRKASRSRR